MLMLLLIMFTKFLLGFSGGSSGKESICQAGDTGLISGSGRSPAVGNDNPLQHPCLENSSGRILADGM